MIKNFEKLEREKEEIFKICFYLILKKKEEEEEERQKRRKIFIKIERKRENQRKLNTDRTVLCSVICCMVQEIHFL